MRALVTGGGGFLGSAIVRQLRSRGDQVVSFSRGAYPELEALGVEQRHGDLATLDAVVDAAKGCDIVFHVAAKAGIWGSFEEYYLANVTGTQNVIAACRIHSINRLVYTGSPSVVFDGSDVEGGTSHSPTRRISRRLTRTPRRSPNRPYLPPTPRRLPPFRCAPI